MRYYVGSGRDVADESGFLFTRFFPLRRGGSPDGRTPPAAGAWAAFVTHRIPEIFVLAHPEWIPAVPRALANWVRGSFKLTGNCKTKEQAVPGAKCLIALLKCLGIGLVCDAGAQVH